MIIFPPFVGAEANVANHALFLYRSNHRYTQS